MSLWTQTPATSSDSAASSFTRNQLKRRTDSDVLPAIAIFIDFPNLLEDVSPTTEGTWHCAEHEASFPSGPQAPDPAGTAAWSSEVGDAPAGYGCPRAHLSSIPKVTTKPRDHAPHGKSGMMEQNRRSDHHESADPPDRSGVRTALRR